MSYTSEVLVDAPVVYYRLGEITGIAAADGGSGTNVPGTYTGGYTLGRPSLSGDADYCVELDGTSGYVVSNSYNAKFNMSGSMSLEAIVSFSSLATMGIVSREGQYRLDTVGGRVRFTVWDLAGASILREVLSNSNLNDLLIYHVVGVVNGAVITLYVNGTAQANPVSNCTGIVSDISDIQNIGRYSTNSNFFAGKIDEVALYNYALDVSRINLHFYQSRANIGVVNFNYVFQAGVYNTITETMSFALTQNLTDSLLFAYGLAFTSSVDGNLIPDISLSETIIHTPMQIDVAKAIQAFSESIILTPSFAVGLSFVAVMNETIRLADSATPAQILNSIINENITFVIAGPGSGDKYIGWVVNAETNAPSMYQGYNFNSFAKHGNRYLGANSDGIYELVGIDDAGTSISASVLTPKMNFDSVQLKSMADAFIGIAQNGDVFLRVVHEDNPSYTYKLVTTNSYMRNARVKPGKGIKLVYWQFELFSTGAEFELESMKFYPLILSRRFKES